MSTVIPALEWNIKSRRAILQRVNRLLAKRGEKLICGVGRERQRMGGWFHVNEATGRVIGVFVDLEHCARMLGVLRAWEKLDPEASHVDE
jgi:hypothetical protein